jgi:hypothetical protein
VKEFDIFIPLTFNDGEPVPGKVLQELQRRLLDRFEGLTFFPQPNRGFWKLGPMTYQDEIVIYRVLTNRGSSSRRYLSALKKWLKSELRQEEILIIERTVDLLP